MKRVLVSVVLLSLFGCNDTRNILTYSTHDPLSQLTVLDGSGRVLWQIRARGERRPRVVRYGEIPFGFQQSVPSNSRRPRNFQVGEDIVIKVLTSREYFEHSGKANGRDQFEGGVWETTPIRSTP